MTVALTALTAAAVAVTAVALLTLRRVLDDHRLERAQHAATIQDLCQRIQAPEQAVIAHAVSDDAPLPQPPAMDDDKGYWDAVKERDGNPA